MTIPLSHQTILQEELAFAVFVRRIQTGQIPEDSVLKLVETDADKKLWGVLQRKWEKPREDASPTSLRDESAHEGLYTLGERAFLSELLIKYERAHGSLNNDLHGLAFSGGGIRSASVCLGFTQALEKQKDTHGTLLHRFDFLSTVSGGGYAGALISMLATQSTKKEDALQYISLNQSTDSTQMPFWKRMLTRGEEMGKLPSFLARHLANTFLFLLLVGSGILAICCIAAILWRQLDCPPIHDFIIWSSGNRVLEWNRPFLIPLSLTLAYFLVSLSRKHCSGVMVAVIYGFPFLALTAWLGLPFLLVATFILACVLLWQSFILDDTTQLSPATKHERNRLHAIQVMFQLAFMLLVGLCTGGLFGETFSFGFAVVLAAFAVILNTLIQLKYNADLVRFSRTLNDGQQIHAYQESKDYILINILLIGSAGFVGYITRALMKPASGNTDYFVILYCAILLHIIIGVRIYLSFSQLGSRLHVRLSTLLMIMAGCAWLIAFAVWMSTPNMRFNNNQSVEDLRGSTDWMKQLIALLGLASLPFLRLQDFIQSGMQTTSRTKKWFFNTISSIVLLGIPFLIISSLAKHNISGYAESQDRKIKEADIKEWELLLGRYKPANELQKFLQQYITLFPAEPWRVESLFVEHLLGGPQSTKQWTHCGLSLLPTRDISMGIPEVPPGFLTSKILTDKLNEAEKALQDQENKYFHQLQDTWHLAVPDGNFTWEQLHARRNAIRAELLGVINRRIQTGNFALGFMKDAACLKRLKVKMAAIEKEKGDKSYIQTLRMNDAREIQKPLELWEARVKREPQLEVGSLTLEEKKSLTILGNLIFYIWCHDVPESLPMGFVNRPRVIEHDQLHRLVIALVALLVFVVCYFTIDLNYTSALSYYRRQLSRIWLQTGELDGPENSATNQSKPSLAELRNCEAGLPYHLINTTTDLFDPMREPHRRLELFQFAALHSGNRTLGYCHTSDYQTKGTATHNFPISLATAMAVSGAAVSPMRSDNWLLRAILIATNFRLGQWLPNPGKVSGSRNMALYPNLHNVIKNYPGLERDFDRGSFVFVTDGGHVENLGILPLLQRRCKLIVAFDAGADGEFRFEDFQNLLNKAEQEGVKLCQWSLDYSEQLPLDLTPLIPKSRKSSLLEESEKPSHNKGIVNLSNKFFGRTEVSQGDVQESDSHFVLARIDYPPVDNSKTSERGLLVYIKTTITGREPTEIKLFRRTQTLFPFHPTSEQLFSFPQMEAYRRLGQHIGETVSEFLSKKFEQDSPPTPISDNEESKVVKPTADTPVKVAHENHPVRDAAKQDALQQMGIKQNKSSKFTKK
jgi:hypothetical protein